MLVEVCGSCYESSSVVSYYLCVGGKVSCGNLKTMPQFHWPKLMPLEVENLNG